MRAPLSHRRNSEGGQVLWATCRWKDVGQRRLDQTCTNRTGRHEEDGCWSNWLVNPTIGLKLSGVSALRGRLEKANVPAKAYRLSTIDGWAMRLVSTFPKRSGCDPNLLKLENPKTDYPNIRLAAARMLKAGHGLDVSVILHADDLNRRNLYVAMTRGSRRLVICSRNNLLTPK